MDFLARIISLLSNPIIVSVPMSYSLVFKTSGDAFYALQWTIISLLFAGVVGLFVYYGVNTGLFSDFDISKKEERAPIFAFTAVISFVYFVLIFLLSGPKVLLISLGALLIGVLLEAFINRRIKASIHLAVFSSFSFIVGILYGGIFWIILLLSPFVAWSRIRLKRHKLSETVIGAILGIALVIIIYMVVNYFYRNG
jgi:hypothetical protein